MIKASEIATELRRIADSLDTHGDIELERPSLNFNVSEREDFINTAKCLPKPLYKRATDWSFQLYTVFVKESGYPDYQGRAVITNVEAPRNKICKLIQEAQPAKYDCEPLLSDVEHAELASETT